MYIVDILCVKSVYDLKKKNDREADKLRYKYNVDIITYFKNYVRFHLKSINQPFADSL